VVTLTLRCSALCFGVLQARLFARLAKDIVYRIRVRLIERLKRISLGEYESLGSGTVTTHLVTDLDTLDKFVGETLSRFLVAMLTLVGTASILMWMHWKLALLILLFNPLVIYATVQLGKRVKHLKKLENDSTARFTQALSETLDAIQEIRASNRQGFFLGRLGCVRRKCATTRSIRSGKPTPPTAPVVCCSSSASTSSVRQRCSRYCSPTCRSARCSRCSVTCGS
jgi:ATP-binding cassette subfamily C protein